MSVTYGRGTHVLLCVTGCVAAYKACEVLRGLQKDGCDVRVCMTQAATRFVGPTTFQALSGHPVACDLFDYPESAIPHVYLSEWAELVVVCPATADVMARMAHGIADDVVTSALLAATCPTLVAPAMNVHMWEDAATQANVSTLRSRGIEFVGPATGRLACGDVGAGKMAPVDEVVRAALAMLDSTCALSGRSVVVTAGPTHEAIDPVRFLANASSGKMGFAIARALARHGAEVTLVAGPVSLPTPEGVDRVDVTTSAQMLEATLAAFAHADAAVCAAAVADYAPVAPADHKMKKRDEPLDHIDLRPTTDVLATLCSSKADRIVVGFAAETDDLLTNAREKLVRKGADLIVANDVSRADSTFGSDTDKVTLVSADGAEELDVMAKADVAEAIVARLTSLLCARTERKASC